MKLSNINKIKSGIKRDIVTTRVLFDPIVIPVLLVILRFPCIKPNHLTITGFLFAIFATIFFTLGYPVIGGIMYYMFFLFDRMDGTLARATNCFHPLGKFYDFVVDRNSVWLMSTGAAFAAWRGDSISIMIMYFVYISLFLLKDVWNYEINSVLPDQMKRTKVHTTSKIHFKPGQVLSCHFAFLFAPITGMYNIFMVGAIICVLLSLAINGLVPFWHLFRKYGLTCDNEQMRKNNGQT